MSVEFHSFPHHEVAALLPQTQKERIDSKVLPIRNKLQGPDLNYGKPLENRYPFIVAAGVMIAVAGFFLVSAAYQILPQGINAISNLGVGGRILADGVLALGVFGVIIGSLKSCQIYKQNSKIAGYKAACEVTHYNAEVAEMDAYFPNRLNQDELFIVEDAARSQITIYYQEWSEDRGVAFPRFAGVSYANSSAEMALKTWGKQNPVFVIGKSCIALQTLQQRTQDFENTKTQEIM